MVSVSIVGRGVTFVLVIEGFEEPTPEDEYDWLEGRAELDFGEAGHFSAREYVTPLRSELQRFRDELHALLEAQVGVVHLWHIEERYEVKIKISKKKKATMSGYLVDLDSDRRYRPCAWLRFNERIEIADLKTTLASLDEALTAFPFRPAPPRQRA